MATNNWSHAATVFAVAKMSTAVEFYTKILGFSLEFSWGEPTTYAVLKRADLSIHLTLKEDDSTPSASHNRLYVFVYDIQKAFDEIVSNGGKTLNTPTTHDYGMTDFDLKDPDGHIITIGSGH